MSEQGQGAVESGRTVRLGLGYTNAAALRAGLTPCETDPARGGLSRTSHPFHGVAAVTVGSQRGNLRHVCEECAEKWHKHQERRGGVRWD